jgi:hypothetical protein
LVAAFLLQLEYVGAREPKSYGKVDESILPVTPQRGYMNPEYERLGELAKQIVIQTMLEGEQTHPDNEWQTVSIETHLYHATLHELKQATGDTSEDHIAHALTRLAMIKAAQKA